ncbi:aldo/keto reductase [Chytriomyces sp. MP71]|nr:aldo/keto reductase [Chytriomyces sp. MP71]
MVITTTTKLNNGIEIPTVGLGVYQVSPEECYNSVLNALKQNYRHIDTAAIYKNEADVGRAIKDSGVPRSEIFITTKLWVGDIGATGSVAKALERSLQALGVEYIDLWIIHSPIPGKRVQAYQEMETLYEQGKVRAIGVSNYGVHHLEELLAVCKVKPAVNQIEMTPFLQRREIVALCKQHGIVIEAYSPLTRAKKLGHPVVVKVAQNVGKGPAQVLIRWGLQKGFVSLPKTVSEKRLAENYAVFDWSISDEDMAALDELEENFVTGWDPITWDAKDTSLTQWIGNKVFTTALSFVKS